MSADPIGSIDRVSANTTYVLRQRVLRPHQSIAEVAFAGDNDADTAHFAAFGATHEIIGIVTVLHEPPTIAFVPTPDEPSDPGGPGDVGGFWRLRGMGIAEGYRRLGVGSDLVAAVVAYVAAQQGTVLWCQARMAAVAFYRAAGFVPAGDPWVEPVIGPHVVMWRPILPTP